MHIATTTWTRTAALGLAASALLAGLAGTAHAQSVERAAAEAISLTVDGVGSMRSKANDWMIMESGTTTVGGTMQFMTARGGLGDDEIRFTDIVLVSLNARRAFAKRYEVFGAAKFLPKQPSFTDELEWQGASGGLRVGMGNRYAAYLAASGGPLMTDRGNWAAGAVGAQVRKSLHETLVVEGGTGLAYTTLFEDERANPSRLVEAIASGELVFRAPNGAVAGWVGTEFRFPVIDHSSAASGGLAEYDPQTRVNFHLGFVMSYIEDWDIFAKLVVVDRGDQIDPTTTLPILEGGFDQQHLIVGLTHRFRAEPQSGSSGAYIAR